MWFIQARFATRDVESRKFWTSPETAPAQVQKSIEYFFKAWSASLLPEPQTSIFTTQAPVPSKTFRRLLVLSKAAGSGGSGSESGSSFLFATVGGIGPITFRK